MKTQLLSIASVITMIFFSPMLMLKAQTCTFPTFTLSIVNPTCSNIGGSITIKSVTSDLNLSYSFDGGLTYQISNTKSNLVVGDYSIKIKKKGCTNIVGLKAKLSLEIPVIDRVECLFKCTETLGTITITPKTPSVNYEYSFDDGLTYQSSNVKNYNLIGLYKMKIRNKVSQCVSNPMWGIIEHPDVPETPEVSIVAQPTCVIKQGIVRINNPVINAVYSFDNGINYQLNQSEFYLSPNKSYSVVVKNKYNECESERVYISILPVPDPPRIWSVHVTQPTQQKPTGSIDVNQTGGDACRFNNNISYSCSASGIAPNTWVNIEVYNSTTGCKATTTEWINPLPVYSIAPTTGTNSTNMVGKSVLSNQNETEQIELSSAVNYGKLQQKSISISPNPVLDVLTINNLKEDANISILNLQGQKMYNQLINGNQSVNVSQLSKGVYFIKIEQATGQKVLKFIKN
ncbi:MAG: T9SS type A sorting domain-containing protein [Saprospiraceae bacterium]|nr:T9SS type A sorting domain-containing protein [Saprospiraceae bacterium]